MYCNVCGAELDSTSSYCPVCGVQRTPVPEKRYKLITPGFILGILSSVLIVTGLCAPAIDFSVFNASVDLQYNLPKICKNVGLISTMWRAIPAGFIIAAVMMFALSFVKIPVFRVIPCILAVAMLLLMILDIGNIIDWIKAIIQKYFQASAESGTSSSVNVIQILHSMMCGVYFLIAGIVSGIVSIFVR
jgi:hypothetical protein